MKWAAEKTQIHPSVLRWYEQQGFISSPERTQGGHRRYSQKQVYEAIIAQKAMTIGWMGGVLRQSALELVRNTALGDLCSSLEGIDFLLKRMALEIALAEDALAAIAAWREGDGWLTHASSKLITISQAATLTGTTADQIRNWERNALMILPRNPQNGYRMFGDEDLSRIKVLRYCRLAGYSITALRRLMQTVDAQSSLPLSSLRQVANERSSDEEGFEAFPTDQWLHSLTFYQAELSQIPSLLQQLKNL
ncbi:MAG: MerR family transcriptional regulator [Spirochaetales bacterium]|nr:MerR family transcriptional regulator [Spirochaetales bacterium]